MLANILSSKISIAGLDKAVVLCALYHRAKKPSQGFFFRKFEAGDLLLDLNYDGAQEMLKKQTLFECINGRRMYIDLSSNDLYTYRYNFYNGANSAENTIEYLRAEKALSRIIRP